MEGATLIDFKSDSWLQASRSLWTSVFALQNGEIFFRLGGGTFAHQIAERKDQRIRNRVNSTRSLLPTSHQAAFPQKIQVLRDVWLIGIKIFHQLRNRLLGSGQGLKDPQTKWFGKIMKAPCDQFKCSAGQSNLAHDRIISLHAHILKYIPAHHGWTLANIASERTPR